MTCKDTKSREKGTAGENTPSEKEQRESYQEKIKTECHKKKLELIQERGTNVKKFSIIKVSRRVYLSVYNQYIIPLCTLE